MVGISGGTVVLFGDHEVVVRSCITVAEVGDAVLATGKTEDIEFAVAVTVVCDKLTKSIFCLEVVITIPPVFVVGSIAFCTVLVICAVVVCSWAVLPDALGDTVVGAGVSAEKVTIPSLSSCK